MASKTITSKNGNVSFKIISFNVRGLRNQKKRRSLFYLFKKNNYDIICLQETYLLKSDRDLINKEWGPLYNIAEGTKRSKGLLTLFSPKLKEFNVSLIKENERFLISELAIDNMSFTIVNVYAPCVNTEKKKYF